MNPSQTPRTDKLSIQWKAYADLHIDSTPITFKDFARQLELETIQLQARVKELEERNNLWEQGKTLPIPDLVQERDSLKEQLSVEQLVHQAAIERCNQFQYQLTQANAAIVEMRNVLKFIKNECDWDTFAGEGGGGDERIGPSTDKALSNPIVQQAK